MAFRIQASYMLVYEERGSGVASNEAYHTARRYRKIFIASRRLASFCPPGDIASASSPDGASESRGVERVGESRQAMVKIALKESTDGRMMVTLRAHCCVPL